MAEFDENVGGMEPGTESGGGTATKERLDFGAWAREHGKVLFAAGTALGLVVVGLVAWHFIARHYQLADADARLAAAKEMASSMVMDADAQKNDLDVLAAEQREVLPPPVVPDQGETTETWDYAKYARGIEEHKTDPYMTKRIDFAQLQADVMSDDVHSWVFIPNTDIDYIVMQGSEGDDPLKYLWRDVYGKESNTGSLFVRADNGLEDDHEIIYGHRLVDHNLFFGPLMYFRDNEGYADQHTTAYTYTDRRVTKWELCYVCTGKNDDEVYYYPYTRDSYEWWDLNEDLKEHAAWTNPNAEFDMLDHMLVLSTCSMASTTTPDRLYLVYRDVAWWDY